MERSARLAGRRWARSGRRNSRHSLSNSLVRFSRERRTDGRHAYPAIFPGQSAGAADKVIEELMIALGRLDELRQEHKEARAKMKKVHRMTATETSETTARMEDTTAAIKKTESTLLQLRGALGTRATEKWDALRGDAYLRARVNARRLREVIRSSLKSHKFERDKLEKSFRRHIMRTSNTRHVNDVTDCLQEEKEHTQVRDLVHRREKNVSAQVRRYNALVDQMKVLVTQGKAPRRRTVVPHRLDTRKLFRLDVDDDIWQEDPGLGPQDEGALPRWQTDEDVKTGIVLLLEERRCMEELERVEAEVRALGTWWKDERDALRRFLASRTGARFVVLSAIRL